jgi:protein O-GlcNAc transferase
LRFEFTTIFQKLNAYLQSQSIDIKQIPQNKLLLQFALDDIEQAPFDQRATIANHYGVSFHRLNQLPFAIQCFLRAISFSPPLISALSNLGLTYLDQNQFTEGIRYLEQAYQQLPTNEIHANNLLSAYISAGKIEQALSFAQALITNDSIKHSGLIFHNYGQILSKIGLGEEAQRLLDKAYELGQIGVQTENNRLYQLLFHELDANQIAQAHFAWGKRMNERYAVPKNLKRKVSHQQSDTKYRLAFISPDFRVHSVSYFFKSLRFDLFFQDFEISCYYHYHLSDHVTEEIKNQADAFYQINHWDDQTLLQHIQ